MTTATHEGTSGAKTSTGPGPDAVFDDAVKAFESAFQAGLKIHEEGTRWMQGWCEQRLGPEEMQKKTRAVAGDMLESVRKNMEDASQVLSDNAKESMEMLQKALDAARSESLPDAQAQVSQMWESSLTTLRKNAQAMMQANTRTLETWKKVMGDAPEK